MLLIAIDDLNDWVGVLGGHPQARTPHLDRLAARGTLFANAHCQAPVCAPSRASLMTGRLPSSTGFYFLHPELGDVPAWRNAKTLTRRFAAAGYETLGVGKIHHNVEAPFFETYGGKFGGFGPRPKEKISYPIGHPLWDWGAFPASDDRMPDQKIADWAIARLREARSRPFLLAVGFYRPHVPMYAPPKWFDLHPRRSIRLPVVQSDDREDLPEYAKLLTIGHPAPRHQWFVEAGAWQDAVQAYLACTTFVDHQVGRVLDALDRSPHGDDTIVVLFSDHGFHLGEKQRWAKRSLWEESTRVPLILRAPGKEPGVCREPAGLIDIFPTLLELCGLPADPALEGSSLVPWLDDPGAPREVPAITTFGPGNHAVRARDHRYIRYRDGSEELYDHRRDPHEWHNLASDPAMRPVLERLRRSLPHHEAPLLPGSRRSAGYRAWRAAARKVLRAGNAARPRTRRGTAVSKERPPATRRRPACR